MIDATADLEFERLSKAFTDHDSNASSAVSLRSASIVNRGGDAYVTLQGQSLAGPC
jgi:hypothetical protein